MTKSVKVIMFPVKESKLGLLIDEVMRDEKLKLYDEIQEESINFTPQHLYLLSDEEIKKGDYVLHVFNNNIGIAKNDITENKLMFRKLIATTDKSLAINADKNNQYQLPQIPESFVKAYVEANGTIENVELEIFNPAGGMMGKIKLTNNNEVIIIEEKERIYSRNDLFKAYIHSFANSEGKIEQDLIDILIDRFDEWTKEKL